MMDSLFGGLFGGRPSQLADDDSVTPKFADTVASAGPVWRADASVANPMTGLGGWNDKGSAARPNPFVLPLSDEELRALWGSNGITRRIVTLLPTRATRKGACVDGTEKDAKRLKVWSRAKDAMVWARVYGGSAALLITEDDVPGSFRSNPGEWLQQPMDMERIGKLHAIHVFDSFEAYPYTFDNDITSQWFRQPKLWMVNTEGFSGLVHASRVVHFRGNPRPPSEARGRGFWNQNRMPDDSLIQSMWDEIRRLTETSNGGAVLAAELRESVLKVGNFSAGSTGDEASALQAKMGLISRAKSILGMIIIGQNDEYTNRSNPPTGFQELSDAAKSMLATVSGYPEVILFGESPSGLNTDGESAHQAFRQQVSDFQEENRDQFERFFEVIYASQDGPTSGQVPEDWHMEFYPLDEPSEKDKAATRLLVAQMDTIYLTAGVYSAEDVAKSRFGAEGWELDMEEVQPPTPEDVAARKALGAPPALPGGAAGGADRPIGSQAGVAKSAGRKPDQPAADSDEVMISGNPYAVEKHGSGYVVVKISSGEVMGRHPTYKDALAQFRALEAAEHKG